MGADYEPNVTEFYFITESEEESYPDAPESAGEGSQSCLQGIEYGVFHYFSITPGSYEEGFNWET